MGVSSLPYIVHMLSNTSFTELKVSVVAKTMSSNKETIQNGPQFNEDLEHSATHATYLVKDNITALSEEHRQYLLQRYGTIDLDPLPTMGDEDPYNWPSWKVLSLSKYSMNIISPLPENRKPGPSRFPRLHVDVYSCSYHSSIREHCPRPRCQPPTDFVSHLPPNRHPRRCTAVLASTLYAFWSPAHLSRLPSW